jgi:two-component system sensor histidine kinase SenX3
VLKASAPAYAFGLVRGNTLVVPELLDLVAQVRRDGQIRESELDLPGADGGIARTLTARVAPLGARLVLALVEDRTRERRVEAVRRDFVANVSHELKTPVGAIRLLAEAVTDAADDPEAVQRFANRMLTESDRLSKLVQQIIELSRLQGHDPLETPVMVDLDAAVTTAVDTSAMEAAAKEITVESRGEHGLEVFGSQEQIGAAISNLVANAVAYSGSGSRVVVTTRAAGEQVQISVVDQGIGIPADEIERIFERFYRVDPARHRSTGGTGLGLAIVKHVAATHGGDVSVWSVEGQGSTFTLTLPRNSQPGQGPGPTTPVEVVVPTNPAAAPTRPSRNQQEVRP